MMAEPGNTPAVVIGRNARQPQAKPPATYTQEIYMNKREDLWNQIQTLITAQRAALTNCERRKIDPSTDADISRRMSEIQRLENEIRALDHASDLDRLERESNLSTMVGPPPLTLADGGGNGHEPRSIGNFRSVGDFMECVIRGRSDRLRDLPIRESRDLSTGVPSAGGVLVPPQYRAELLRVDPAIPTIRGLARVFPPDAAAPDAETNWPALDHGGDRGRLAGVTAGWVAEGGLKFETQPVFASIKLTPRELAAFTELTDKILRNSNVGQIVADLLRDALSDVQEAAFFNGDGAGKPLGIMQSPCRIQIPRTAPGGIAWADVTAMLGRLPTGSLRGRSTAWICASTSLPALLQLEDTAANALIKADSALRTGVPNTLYGLPIIYNERSPALGDVGDLILADLSYYLIADGSGPFLASDGGIVNFKTNRTLLKAFFNVDGQALLSEPLQLPNGQTVSPFVVLQ